MRQKEEKIGKKQSRKRGFTLVELLIVIAILSILAFATILILNPAEILRKSRDTQRISDLDTLKSAIALYITSVSSPDLDGSSSGTCGDESSKKIYISLPTSVSPGTPTTGWAFAQAADTAYTKVGGTGWILVNLDDVTGGSPISKLPVDPKNTTDGTPSGNDLYYRYACNSSTATKPVTFEINAIMESNFFKPACTGECNDVSKKDGGDLDTYYEVGTNLLILPNATTF